MMHRTTDIKNAYEEFQWQKRFMILYVKKEGCVCVYPRWAQLQHNNTPGEKEHQNSNSNCGDLSTADSDFNSLHYTLNI